MRLGRARVAVASLIAIAIGEGGCAMIMQQSPKENRARGEMPVCSTGRGGVVLDGLLATMLGAGALIGFASDEPGVGLALGALSGIYTYSAVKGHRSAGKCEDALKSYEMEIAARHDPAPPPPRSAPVDEAAGEPPALAQPAGPPLEDAPPAEEETPVPDQPPAEEPVSASAPAPAAPAAPRPAPAPRDWSEFWIEVKR